jgi:hypothetical protein
VRVVRKERFKTAVFSTHWLAYGRGPVSKPIIGSVKGLWHHVSQVNREGSALRVVLVVLALAAGALAVSVMPASAHRSRCHQRHTCPSDHATYRWRGLLCVHRTAEERNATFRKRVVYGGRVYFCKR